MALTKFSLREVSARPGRALLTFLSIAIGVGSVVAVLQSVSTTRQSQRDMLREMAGKADLEVVSDDTKGFDVGLLKTIRETPGVEVAVPSLSRYAKLIRGDANATARVLGIDPRIDQRVRDYDITAGEPVAKRGEIVLDSSFADSLNLHIGDEVRLLAHGGVRRYRIVGLATPRGTTAVSLNNGAYLLITDAISAFGTRTKIDQVHLIVDPQNETSSVMAVLRAKLPPGITVQPPATRNQMAEETLRATENGLYMAIAFTLILATFIIYNTFQMSVGERRKQLGILRAIGATRRQVRRMILREAVWISVIASVAGCLLGAFGADWLTSATSRLLQVHLPGVQWSWIPFTVAVGCGIGVSVMGALLPARRASLVEPIEAIRNLESADNAKVIAITRPLCVISLLIGIPVTLLGANGWLPLGGDIVGIVFLLFALVLSIPSGLDRLSRVLAEWLRPWLGVEAELGQRQLTRHLGRSTLTIGVLLIAISSSTGMAGNILDNVANVYDWYTRTIIGDFFVRATSPNLAIGATASMPDGIGDQLKLVPGIESIDSIRYLKMRSQDHDVMLVVRDFVGQPGGFFDLVEGTEAGALEGLSAGKVVVGTVLAQRLDLHLGDTLQLQGPRGPETLEIVGLNNEYIAGGLTVYMQREIAERLLNVTGVDAYVVQADDNKLAEVQQELQKICQANNIILESYADAIRVIKGIVNSVTASLWMLLILGCLIATMGLVNTLTMNILEQTREIGMLRVVAMTRRQVRRMIIAEAALLGMVGLVPGSIIGVGISYVMALSAARVLGHHVVFQFRPGLILICLVVSMLVVVVASVVPAERAARLKIAMAIRDE